MWNAGTLLLVDDELAILLTLKTILEIEGYEVDTATTAKDAISKIKANVYRMVITDEKIEHDKAGYDVVRAARKARYKPAVATLAAYPLLGGDWKTVAPQERRRPMNTDEFLQRVRTLIHDHEAVKQTKNKRSHPSKKVRGRHTSA